MGLTLEVVHSAATNFAHIQAHCKPVPAPHAGVAPKAYARYGPIVVDVSASATLSDYRSEVRCRSALYLTQRNLMAAYGCQRKTWIGAVFGAGSAFNCSAETRTAPSQRTLSRPTRLHIHGGQFEDTNHAMH